MRQWWASQQGLSRFAVAAIVAVVGLLAAYWVYVVVFHDFR
jgi:hypothetical protein